jgi:hypothetical protein
MMDWRGRLVLCRDRSVRLQFFFLQRSERIQAWHARTFNFSVYASVIGDKLGKAVSSIMRCGSVGAAMSWLPCSRHPCPDGC